MISQSVSVKPSLALIDSGVSLVSPLLRGITKQSFRVHPNCSVAEVDGPLNDYYGHGTLMAGIVQQLVQQIDLYDVGVLDEHNACSAKMLATAIDVARDLQADVILLPLSTIDADPIPVIMASLRAISDGKIVVAAYQNVPSDAPSFPAEVPGVFGVRRSNSRKPLAWHCRTGDLIEIAAFSDKIPTLSRDGNPTYTRGNSSASAIIASACCSISCDIGSANRTFVLQELIARSQQDVCFASHPSLLY